LGFLCIINWQGKVIIIDMHDNFYGVNSRKGIGHYEEKTHHPNLKRRKKDFHVSSRRGVSCEWLYIIFDNFLVEDSSL